MNRKLVREFSEKLEVIDEELTFKITKEEAVQIKDGNEPVCTLAVIYDVPSIIIDPGQPILLDKDTSALYGDLIKLCGEYLGAFLGDDDE